MKNPTSAIATAGAAAGSSIPMLTTGNLIDISLYFHIPFCTRKCDYCHFYVVPDKEPSKQDLMEGFEVEWQLRRPFLAGKRIVSIYFGGGTPSLLGPDRIKTILGWIHRDCVLDPDAEMTLEANPENVTLPLMQAYAEAGINRVSIGIQTLDNRLLQTLTRSHNAQKGIQAVCQTVDAGIRNVSIDLMYDLPGQDLSAWQNTLAQAVDLPITHLSLYNLTLEPHTVFFKKQDILRKQIPDEETSLRMYEMAVDMLEKGGLSQYEISAFARDKKMSVHNVGYWTARPFLGFGPSAYSYWNGKRFRNVCNLSKYCKALTAGDSPVDFEEELDPSAKRRELFVVQIRLREGVDLNDFQKKHGSLEKEDFRILDELKAQGLVSLSSNQIRLTRRGILFYDTVASELI